MLDTTGNILDHEYFKYLNHDKLIPIDLSKHIELEKHNSKQQIYFIAKLEKIMEQQYFLSLKN